MDWRNPSQILLIVALLPALWWFQRRSLHPMTDGRRRALFVVRTLLVALLLTALAQPAWKRTTQDQAVVFVVDHSQSAGEEGLRAAHERAAKLAAGLDASIQVGFVSTGDTATVLKSPSVDREPPPLDSELPKKHGTQSDLEAGLLLARGIFPPDTACRVVLLSDGLQTRGDLEGAARDAAAAGIVIDAAPIAGPFRPDVRVVAVRSSRTQLSEGAALEISADLESSLAGAGRVRLFENGIEVESQPLELKAGDRRSLVFQRTPSQRGMFTYRVRIDGFEGDKLADNDEGAALVDVRGQPSLLYVEGEPGEAHYLIDAMAKEGLRLHTRPAAGIPDTLQGLAGFDGVILSDIPAREFNEGQMQAMRNYVEQLGGGFLMIGGSRSFGVGGYYRTPIEEILPVKIKAPDTQMQHSTALALVVDRSGSMQGQKIELCKSACAGTVELLTRKDYLAVVAFDDHAHWVVPMEQLTSPQSAVARISGITSDGGTNLQPAMNDAYQALAKVSAKLKHMIILTDGQTGGGGYEALAAQMKAERMTVSTVAVGGGADIGLLQRIAAAGGGQAYVTTDPSNIPKIFTQDAMVHIGKLIHEASFVPKQVERHPMLAGWDGTQTPPLLGYVRTLRRPASQAPLVTELGDPLLAHWRFGLGKVTAFTSDCKSRWGASWVAGWPGYSRFWAQVLREMARSSQGRGVDLAVVEQRSGRSLVRVDLTDSAGEFRNDADVAVDVYFTAAGASQSGMKLVDSFNAAQFGPGRYEGHFSSQKPGVYMVRARSGGEMASAGIVSNVSGEMASGRVDEPLLKRVCETTGGKVLAADDIALPPLAREHVQYRELAPLLLRIILLLFLADIAIRRWENILGLWETRPRAVRL